MKLVSYPWIFVIFVLLFAILETVGVQLSGAAQASTARSTLLAAVEQEEEPPAVLAKLAQASAGVVSLLGGAPAPSLNDLMLEPIPQGLGIASRRLRNASSAALRTWAHRLGLEARTGFG